MNSELRVTLPNSITDDQSITLDEVLKGCRHIHSSLTLDGVARLGLQPGTSIFPSKYNSKLWKYDWYNQPATSVILITQLSDGIMHETATDAEKPTDPGTDTEIISQLGYGDALVFHASSPGGPRTLHPIRAKGFISFPNDRRSTINGSGPGTLSLAHSAQYAYGGRGKAVSYKGTVKRTTVGNLSITEWTSVGPGLRSSE